MGGFFGAVSKNDVINEVFYGTDYHSHLGTRRGGMAAYDKEIGLQRDIHNIQNSPFRTKFEKVFDEMYGTSAIGCISDFDPQPLLIRSKIGTYALCFIGAIENSEELIEEYLSESGHYFDSMTGGKINSVELLAALINQKDNFVEGIKFAQSLIKGSTAILILTNDGKIIAARDSVGRLPIHIGKNDDGLIENVGFNNISSIKEYNNKLYIIFYILNFIISIFRTAIFPLPKFLLSFLFELFKSIYPFNVLTNIVLYLYPSLYVSIPSDMLSILRWSLLFQISFFPYLLYLHM